MSAVLEVQVEHKVIGMTRETNYITYILWSKKSLRDPLIFFYRENGCYVYDDELIASKANDVELCTLSDRKTGGEVQQ